MVFRQPDIGLITDLSLGGTEEGKGPGVLVVGNRGVCRVTAVGDGKPACIRLAATNLAQVTVVRLLGRNETAFLARGLWGSPAAALIDETGQLSWSYDAKYALVVGPAIAWLSEQRIDAVVMYIRGRGMVLIDPSRNQTISDRSMPTLRDLITIGATTTGDSQILSLDEGGTVRLQTVGGLTVAESKLTADFSKLTVATGPSGEITVVLASQSAIHLLSSTLKTLGKIPVELERGLQLKAAASVPCGATQGSCLATLFAGRGGWHRTVLFLHSPSGELLHHEVLEGDYQSVLGLPVVGGQAWGIWVGGRGEVVEYRWR